MRRPTRYTSKAAALVIASAGPMVGCDAIQKKLFTRESPVVNQAIRALDTKDAGEATSLLTEYLSTGPCADGTLGVPDLVRERPNASVDLGLALFQLAERYGEKFGELPATQQGSAPPGQNDAVLAKRSGQVDCALRIVRPIAADTDVPLSLRAQAYYLGGNLEFLRHDYRLAVESYDEALRLYPGGLDAGLDVGDRAAFNRAIALQRIEDEPDPPKQDGGPPQDGGQDENEDQEDEEQDDSEDQKEDDQQEDNQDKEQDPKDRDGGASPEPEQDQEQQQEQEQQQQSQQEQPAEPPPSLGQDERMLDMLERAPMLQHAKPPNGQRRRVVSGMEDK